MFTGTSTVTGLPSTVLTSSLTATNDVYSLMIR